MTPSAYQPAGDTDEFAAGPEVGAVLQECPATVFEQGNARQAYLTEVVSAAFTALCFTQEVPPAGTGSCQALATPLSNTPLIAQQDRESHDCH